MSAPAIGIDFGTTNSALAWQTDEGTHHVAQFLLNGKVTRTFRSLLYFEAEREWVGGRPEPWIGPSAIEHYLATDGEGRLMQSMKTFLASRVVKGTHVFGHEFPLERLIALIVSALCREASPHGPRRIVAGRPVRFAGSEDDASDRHAEGRLRNAFAMAGLPEVELVLEPVAAALHYESTVERDETVLVADFGGGTSDFCILKVGPSYRGRVADRSRVLATRGLGVAGDNLDSRIIQQVVAPLLGAGTSYRSESGNILPIPPGIFEKVRRWNELSFLKTRQNMDVLLGYAKTARAPERLRALIHLVDHNLGYRLFRAVEAAKVALSSHERTTLELVDGPLEVRADVTREDFERWIEPELLALGTAIDKTLDDSGLTPDTIDNVFLTGGTGQVPAVRRLFTERFGATRVRTGDFLTSIASGLALHAARADKAPDVVPGAT